MNIVDVMIYIRNSMNPDKRQKVEDTLRAIDGVIAPRFVANRDKLVIVAYNPEKVQASSFREAFSHMGLEAIFVGM